MLDAALTCDVTNGENSHSLPFYNPQDLLVLFICGYGEKMDAVGVHFPEYFLLCVVNSSRLADNADLDLTGIVKLTLDLGCDVARKKLHVIVGYDLGLNHDSYLAACLNCEGLLYALKVAFLEKQNVIATEVARLERTTVPPSDAVNAYLEECGSTRITTGIKLAELLRRPEISYESMAKIDIDRPALPMAVRVSAEVQIKYEGYVKRELAEVARQKKLEEKRIPDGICYKDIVGLRLEAAEKLDKIRPASIGQASRISGVSPADVSVLLIYLSTYKK